MCGVDAEDLLDDDEAAARLARGLRLIGGEREAVARGQLDLALMTVPRIVPSHRA